MFIGDLMGIADMRCAGVPSQGYAVPASGYTSETGSPLDLVPLDALWLSLGTCDG